MTIVVKETLDQDLAALKRELKKLWTGLTRLLEAGCTYRIHTTIPEAEMEALHGRLHKERHVRHALEWEAAALTNFLLKQALDKTGLVETAEETTEEGHRFEMSVGLINPGNLEVAGKMLKDGVDALLHRIDSL